MRTAIMDYCQEQYRFFNTGVWNSLLFYTILLVGKTYKWY